MAGSTQPAIPNPPTPNPWGVARFVEDGGPGNSGPSEVPHFRHDDATADAVDSSEFYTVVGSSLTSMAFHLVGLIVLAVWVTPVVERSLLPLLLASSTFEEEELETVLLDDESQPATDLALVSSAPTTESAAQAAADKLEPFQLTLDDPLGGSRPEANRQRNDVPADGDLMLEAEAERGVARAVVDDYQQAIDRITLEILRMLDKGKVLVVWCFDQSQSMKDDQREIRDRIDRVYAELGLTGATSGDVLKTGVTSFGQAFAVHTKQPTSNLDEIRAAIDAVPVDTSGEEMMCLAVMESIATHRTLARSERRQLALILVSDESGSPQESERYLELTIDQALAARCKVYVLGREAVFGSRLAKVRWVHPETGATHWLPVDRGPETAAPEQLMTDGFGPRTDAYFSGFGPYAQSRLAWRTGGIFFILPSVETQLYRSETRRYDLDVLQPYRPDLRSRAQIAADLQRNSLRGLIWKIVTDLDPARPQLVQARGKMCRRFSPDPKTCARQIVEARAVAESYLAGLSRAAEALDAKKASRDRDPSLRWKANYDLLRAQVEAYAARVYLYGAALDAAVEKYQQPPKPPPSKKFVGWRVQPQRGIPLDETAAKMLERSRDLYLAVIENHPDTPWAARAEWELNRDFKYSATALAADVPPQNAAGLRDAAGEIGDGLAGTSHHVINRVGPGAGAGGDGGGGARWDLDGYAGVELVPEFRAPTPPRPRNGGNGGGGRPPRPPVRPQAPRMPLPKL